MIKQWKDKTQAPSIVALDCIGGAVADAYEIMKAIEENKMGTVVLQSHYCLSACVMIYAAGMPRYISSSAVVGVHRANTDEGETADALLATRIMEKIYTRLHVPEHVKRKMVETPSTDMYYLSPSDKRAFSYDNESRTDIKE